jgi:hypothetical protein
LYQGETEALGFGLTMKKWNKLLITGALITFLSFTSENVFGGTPAENRRILEDKLKALQKTELEIIEAEDRIAVDYGGWLNFRYDDFKDDDNDSSTEDALDYSSSMDFRVWMKAGLKPRPSASNNKQHSLYVRLKDIQSDNRPKDINGGYDHDGPHVDYCYFTVDLRPCWFEIGRRYFSAGQGISYGNLHDGIEFRAELEYWNMKTFASHTLPHEDNIDTSVPGWDKKSSRYFLGAEATYLGISNQGIYGYVLVQRDDSNEEPEDPLQDYTYDSEYFGLGSQGKITGTMHYWAEFIGQTGKSYVYDTNEKRDVRAWGVDLGITYDLDVYSNPNITIAYAYGSGDPDRASVTDTLGGNNSGNDSNFLYFGYLPSGYALSPRISNIHFVKAGVLLKPFEKYPLFENFSLAIDAYRFYKDREAGSISDADASMNDKDLGKEIDLNISWQILSDLSCSFEYGYFIPGNAYPETANDCEEYFSFGTTITF